MRLYFTACNECLPKPWQKRMNLKDNMFVIKSKFHQLTVKERFCILLVVI